MSDVDGEVSGTLGQVQVDRAQHVKAGASAWQARWQHGCPLVQRGQVTGLTDAERIVQVARRRNGADPPAIAQDTTRECRSAAKTW